MEDEVYTVREMSGKSYVIHDETGVSLPYYAKAIKYVDLVPDWKKEYFDTWLGYTRSEREKVKRDSMKNSICDCVVCDIQLAPLSATTATVPSLFPIYTGNGVKQQKGNNPMSRFNEAYANATVSAPDSDAAVQRNYLKSRLNDAIYPKYNELDKLFHRFVNNMPKTYKDLIDAIKSDKFSIDKKIAQRLEDRDDDDDETSPFDYNGPFYGIVWEGPTFDQKAWAVARADAEKEQLKARDIIMTGDGAAGLAAIQAFEAWLPTKETTTVQ